MRYVFELETEDGFVLCVSERSIAGDGIRNLTAIDIQAVLNSDGRASENILIPRGRETVTDLERNALRIVVSKIRQRFDKISTPTL